MLSWAYSVMVKDLEPDRRRELDYALRPDSAVAVDDVELPESMQGLRPPSWWDADAPVDGLISVPGGE